MIKFFAITVLLLSLFFFPTSCKKDTFSVDLPPSLPITNSLEAEKSHQDAHATVTENAIYWEDNGAVYHCSLEGGKETEIAKGRIGSNTNSIKEYVFYSDGNLRAYNGKETVTLPEGRGYITPEGMLIYADDHTLTLLDSKDLTQKKQYPHPVEGLESYVTLKNDTLYWFGKNALQKTDLQSGRTEQLKELGYIGSSVPSFYWFGEQLYFFYSYTVYRCENDQVTPLVNYKEHTACVFGNGYAYVSEPGAPHATLLGLQSAEVVRTLENATGFGSNEWGVAYRTDTHIVIALEEELLIPIPEGTDLIGACYATPNGVLVDSAEKFINVYRNEDGEWIFSHL